MARLMAKLSTSFTRNRYLNQKKSWTLKWLKMDKKSFYNKIKRLFDECQKLVKEEVNLGIEVETVTSKKNIQKSFW